MTELAQAPGLPVSRSAGLASAALRHKAKLTLLGVILTLSALTAARSDVFLTWENLRNVLTQVSIIGILASGMTLLMVSGGMDLSVGSSVSFSGMAMGGLMQNGTSPVWAVAVGVSLATLVGVINGTLAAWTKSHPFIVTLGMLTLVQGATLLISDLPYNGIPDSYLAIVDREILGLPFVVVVFLGITLGVHLILATTKLGRWLYAIGGSENAAHLAGIRVRWVKVGIYALNGFLVGWAAMLLVAQLASSQPYMGQGLELAAIAAVAVGGTPLAGGRGDILGTLMGVLLLGLIANALILLGIPNNLQYVLQGAVIIFAVMAQRD